MYYGTVIGYSWVYSHSVPGSYRRGYMAVDEPDILCGYLCSLGRMAVEIPEGAEASIAKESVL